MNFVIAAFFIGVCFLKAAEWGLYILLGPLNDSVIAFNTMICDFVVMSFCFAMDKRGAIEFLLLFPAWMLTTKRGRRAFVWLEHLLKLVSLAARGALVRAVGATTRFFPRHFLGTQAETAGAVGASVKSGTSSRAAAAEVVAPGKTIAREPFAGSEVSLAAPTVSRALDLAAPVAVFDEAFVAFVKLLVAHSAAQAQMRRGA